MSNFKTYVLDFALKQVNELTDITAKYEQHKKGRSISGFSFTFKQKKMSNLPIKNKRDPDSYRYFLKNDRCSTPSVFPQTVRTS